MPNFIEFTTMADAHLTYEQLDALVEHRTSPREWALIDRHLQNCQECRNKLKEFEVFHGAFDQAWSEPVEDDPSFPGMDFFDRKLAEERKKNPRQKILDPSWSPDTD